MRGLSRNCLMCCVSGCDERLDERACVRLGELKVGLVKGWLS